MTRTRIKGADLALSIGGVDYFADATSVVLDNEEASSDVVTFADAKAGGTAQEFFTVSAVQSTDPDSFWSYVWANRGKVVAFRYAPHGNAVATADQPHVIGQAKVGKRPTLGGEAAANGGGYTFETRLDVQGETTLDRGSSAAPLITTITPGKAKGQTAIISGTRFSGVTSVTFDGKATDFVAVSDLTISAVVGGAGAVPVIVKTADGQSAAFTYTVAVSA
ncbi:hypothetical protein CH252_40605 [Rhodococcus sp. 06-1477-1B]|nr:hypothetical protein CH252_40605 [Rhodococcus sp. 06-1477-1B]